MDLVINDRGGFLGNSSWILTFLNLLLNVVLNLHDVY